MKEGTNFKHIAAVCSKIMVRSVL